MVWFVLLALIFIPVAVVMTEAVISVKTRSWQRQFSGKLNNDFQILVPIWGNIKYLENVEYLSQYAENVTLCTTGDESKFFYSELKKISKKYHFQIFIDKPVKSKTDNLEQANQRSTSGTIRDRVIRNALATVGTEYVIPLDADSTTEESFSILIGEMEKCNYDIASIKIVPRNTDSFLSILQKFEYDLAMRFRILAPWLISGACHPAKTKVLKDIMSRHSLFFQGNDVETGLLAKSLKYHVGHIPFVVLTTVPDTFKSWFRQRLAWAGGEFRLFVMNFNFIWKHPFFWFYGALISIFMIPMRWYFVVNPSRQIIIVLVIYFLLSFFVHWKNNKNWQIFYLPFYMLYVMFLSLVMLPLGVYWYFYMAKQDNNYGIIRVNRNH